MKNVILLASDPMVRAMIQETLGFSHRYIIVGEYRNFHTTLDILDPEKPDLIVMACETGDKVVELIVKEKGLRNKMIIMALDEKVHEWVSQLAPVSVYPRKDGLVSDFFMRCNDILGEQ